jgi:hypothetical protein
MIVFGKIISTKFDDLKQRLIKITRYGKSDIQEAVEVSPYGIDSNPIKNKIAIYAPSSSNGKTVIIGYIDKDKLAEVGEMRIFSTNASGVLKAYTWYKNDGTQELNGNADNLVRWSALNTALQNQIAQQQAELVKIAAAFNAIIPGLYVPGTMSLNITPAKITDLKST